VSQEKVFQVGGIELCVSNRVFGDDGGPAIRVFGQVEGNTVQLLRFDCFRKNPHHHYDPTGKDVHTKLDPESDSVGWTIEQLNENLLEMITTAGYETVAETVDQKAVSAVLPEVESLMR